MQEIEVRVSSGIPSALQLTSQRSPVHTTTHVSSSHVDTDDNGDHNENTSQNSLRNADKELRLDSDGVNSRGSTTGEDSSSTGANDQNGSSSEGGEEFCPMDLSSGGGDPRIDNMPPSAAAASALIAAAAAATKESNSSKLESLLPNLSKNHPFFNAHKIAELLRAQKEKQLDSGIVIENDISSRLPKKRAFPELELDLSRMVKERVLKEHDVEPLLSNEKERKLSSNQPSSYKNARFSTEERINETKMDPLNANGMNNSKWDLVTKQISQRRSSSPADSNGSESTSNSATSLSGGNAEVKKRRLDMLLNKKFSSSPSNSGSSPPQRRDSLDASLSSNKNNRRKQAHPSSPASSASIHSNHSSPPPFPSKVPTPVSSTNNNSIEHSNATPNPSTGGSLSIRPVAELLSKHISSSNSSTNRNKNTMNNNHSNRRSSDEFASPSKRSRPNNNHHMPQRSSPSPLKIERPPSNFGSKSLHGLLDMPLGRGSNDLLIPAIRSPTVPVQSKQKEMSQKETHQSELLKSQLLQLQLAAAMNGASSGLPLQNPDFLKMASLLGAGNSIGSGISPSAASNPLLYYGYYAQMLQGVQSQQQKLMEQLSTSHSKQEEHHKMLQDHHRKRKLNSSHSTSNHPDIKPLSSSPLKNNRNGSMSHRLSSPLSSREFKPETPVSNFFYFICRLCS